MGPTILLDKSAFQCLNPTEFKFLYRHFNIVTTEILVNEIVADLSKKETDTEYRVANLIENLHPIGNYFQTPYLELCCSSLLGHYYPMNGFPVLEHGESFTDSDGKPEVYFKENPNWNLIRKWSTGVFSEDDVKFAKGWRSSIETVNWNNITKSKKDYLFPGIKNLKDLYNSLLSQYLAQDKKEQLLQMNSIMKFVGIDDKVQNEMADRFLDSELPFIEYSNYAFYCFMLIQTFGIGMQQNLISTRKSSALDFEYLYYLPCTQVFATNDSTQAEYAEIFKLQHNTIINGNDLKTALSGLADTFESLNDDEKSEYEYHFGSYPPNTDESIVAMLWKKYCNPWKPKSGNTVKDMTSEEKEKILSEFELRHEQSLKGK